MASDERKVPRRDSGARAREAREALREKTKEILDALLQTAVEAREAEDFATAASTLKWLLEHAPADEDGTRAVDSSVDKKGDGKGLRGPRIQIGVAIGGMGTPKQLPESEAVDAEIEEVESES